MAQSLGRRGADPLAAEDDEARAGGTGRDGDPVPGSKNHHPAGLERLARDRDRAFDDVEAAILVVIGERKERSGPEIGIGVEGLGENADRRGFAIARPRISRTLTPSLCGGVGAGCTKLSGCSTATGWFDQDRKSRRQDRSHKSWGEANRRAQCEEIRMLRSTRRGLETRHGRDGVTLADERASQQGTQTST